MLRALHLLTRLSLTISKKACAPLTLTGQLTWQIVSFAAYLSGVRVSKLMQLVKAVLL